MTKSKGNNPTHRKEFKGFLPMFRRAILLLLEGRLNNLTEFGAYSIYLLLTDWDEKHTTFGYIKSDKDMARLTGTDASRWCRHRRRLVAEGLIEKRAGGKFGIPHFWKFKKGNAAKLARMSFASSQEEAAFLQSDDAEAQLDNALSQERQQSNDNGLSGKNNSNDSENGQQIAKTQQHRSPKQTINKSINNSPLPPQR